MCNRNILLLLFCLAAFTGMAQDKKYTLSDPIDIKETGWNRVVLLRNGNTFLLHLENGKPLSIVIFDSLRKQVAFQHITCNVLDISLLKESTFEGLFEINNEVVFFLDQDHQSKRGLLRLRFRATDGVMTEEKRLAESPTMSTPTDFTIVHSRNEDKYAIVYCTDKPAFKKCDLHLTWYDNKHEPGKDIIINADRKSYDKLAVLDAEQRDNGICVCLGMFNMETGGTKGANGMPAQAIHSFFQAYFIPKDSSFAVGTQVVDLTTEAFPAIPAYTYNPFANTLNILLLSFKDVVYQVGQEMQPAAKIGDLFLRFDQGDLKLSSSWIKNSMANDYLRKNTDSNQVFAGIPLLVYTNDNGLTTIIQESFTRHVDPDQASKTRLQSYLGNIAITQYDDDGKEIWGTVLPRMQSGKGTTDFYDMGLFLQKNQSQTMFGDQPELVYARQFLSVNSYTRHRNFYMIFNDYTKNFNNTLKNPGDTVAGYENTNACYYQMDRKKEVTKKHLFGEPGAGEYFSCFTEGADFTEQSGLYASLVRYKKGDNISLRMAWCWLD